MPSNANDGFDRVVFEPAIEEVGGARREQLDEKPLIGEREIEKTPADAAGLDQLEYAAAGVRRSPRDEIAQHADGAAKFGIVSVEARRILLGKSRVGLASRRRPIGHKQSAPIVNRPEIGGRPLDDVQAMPHQFEIGDDLRIEKAHRV